ncbi:MAG TPA: hypothetical protein VGM90_15730 [Kofleriaceae bacterium]|jgi:hypothetical protein
MGKLALVVMVVATLAACGTDSVSEVSPDPLAGMINGQPFTFVGGETNPFLSEGDDNFFSDLYGETYTACGFSHPSGPHLIASIPMTPGEYTLSLDLNMTFTYNDGSTVQNLIATRGRLVVDEVTSTTVTGGLHGIYNGDNEVDGQFSLTVCTQ